MQPYKDCKVNGTSIVYMKIKVRGPFVETSCVF